MSWFNFFKPKNNKNTPNSDQHKKSTANSEKLEINTAHAIKVKELKIRQDGLVEQAKQRHREGHIDEAGSVYSDVINSKTNHAEAHHMFGIVHLQRGQLIEAQKYIRQAIAIDSGKADYYSNLGNALAASGNVEEAYINFAQAINLNPQHSAALGNAASALLEMGKIEQAKTACQTLLELVPNEPSGLLILSAAYAAEREIDKAIAVLKKAAHYHPNNIEILIQLASNLELVNQIEEAQSVLTTINQLHSGIAKVEMLEGIIARRLGEHGLAKQKLSSAINKDLSALEKIETYNQLGLTLDSLGEAKQAFSAFNTSNQLMAKTTNNGQVDGAKYVTKVRDLKGIVNRNLLDKHLQGLAGQDSQYEQGSNIVFFVGFPRSGTTLMEQVLKAHPKIITTDELSPLAHIINAIDDSMQGYPAGLNTLSADDIGKYRQSFMDFVSANFALQKGQILVDKLPLNIVHIGLIKILFPQAKFIVALRDPRAVALSCFMQKFEINNAMANFLDIKSTANAYDAVMDLWLHYRAIIGDCWLEYKYEDLVADFDGSVNQVLTFMGLDWHEDINQYRQKAKQRVILTPSYRDVTAKINTNALARWRNYQDDLQPILPTLQPYVKCFNYDDD